jgi:hypothetical protein
VVSGKKVHRFQKTAGEKSMLCLWWKKIPKIPKSPKKPKNWSPVVRARAGWGEGVLFLFHLGEECALDVHVLCIGSTYDTALLRTDISSQVVTGGGGGDWDS